VQLQPNAFLPGSGGLTCETAQQTQSEQCAEFCGLRTPNGCDCFGCCEVHAGDQTHTVYLGTYDPINDPDNDSPAGPYYGFGTCSMVEIADPSKCAPCIQVAACLNPCDTDHCELCIGMTELPDGCDEAACPDGIQSCEAGNLNTDCPLGFFCLTGCCRPLLN
jgi:hypothetical protein